MEYNKYKNPSYTMNDYAKDKIRNWWPDELKKKRETSKVNLVLRLQ